MVSTISTPTINQLKVLTELISDTDKIFFYKNDLDLVFYLIKELEEKQILNLQELDGFVNYIYSQIELIEKLSVSEDRVALELFYKYFAGSNP